MLRALLLPMPQGELGAPAACFRVCTLVVIQFLKYDTSVSASGRGERVYVVTFKVA